MKQESASLFYKSSSAYHSKTGRPDIAKHFKSIRFLWTLGLTLYRMRRKSKSIKIDNLCVVVRSIIYWLLYNFLNIICKSFECIILLKNIFEIHKISVISSLCLKKVWNKTEILLHDVSKTGRGSPDFISHI